MHSVLIVADSEVGDNGTCDGPGVTQGSVSNRTSGPGSVPLEDKLYEDKVSMRGAKLV